MIIGRDILSQLNIDVRFSDGTIKWEDQLIPMKSFLNIWKNKHPTRKELQATILWSMEPKSTKEATKRIVKILDSKYEKAHLFKIVGDANNLNNTQKLMLSKILKQFEPLFDGTLGRWNTAPVIIEMR